MSTIQDKYVLTFIDDFSRYGWVYFLKLEFEVFDHFKVFKALVENQSGRRLKILRSDNGGEYVKSEFINYCEDAGIQMQHDTPYTPQQNGVAKRKNRSLKEMATCMLESKTLPPKFWAEAINCASYIQNRMPRKQLDGVTPFEAWGGHKPDVSHFKIFGSRAWARIRLDKSRALEPKIQELLFVGYSDFFRGYKLINMRTQKSFTERSVQFEEEPMVEIEIGESSSTFGCK